MSELHEHEHCHDHEHAQEHDHAYLHAHGIAHSHGHGHENQKAVVNRLSRAFGHLEKVNRMVEEGHDCSEVLIQLAAVRSALDNTGKVILKDHMRHCMVDAVAAGDTEAIDDLSQAIDKFMKKGFSCVIANQSSLLVWQSASPQDVGQPTLAGRTDSHASVRTGSE